MLFADSVAKVSINVVSPVKASSKITFNAQGVVQSKQNITINSKSDGFFNPKVFINSFIKKGKLIGVLKNSTREIKIQSLKTQIHILKSSIQLQSKQLKNNQEMLKLGIISKNTMLAQQQQYKIQELKLQRLQQALDMLLLYQKHSNIYAPQSGYVKYIAPNGQYLSYGALLASIMPNKQFVKLFINPSYLKYISKHQVLTLITPQGKQSATISAILPQCSSNLIEVIARPTHRLPLGLNIQAAIPNLVDLGLSQVLGDRLGDIMGAGAAPITIRLFGSSSQELIKESRKLKKVFMGIRNINEVNVQTSYSLAAINVRLKNNALALYGISAKMLQTQIRSLYYGKVIASVMKGDKIINVRVFMSRPAVDPIIYLQKELLIYSPKLHKNIPLNFVATIKYQTKVPQITHYNLSTVSVIGIRFAGNNMSTVVHNIKQKLSHIKLPANINIQIGGFYKQQQKSFKQMGYVIAFALLIIFAGLLLYFSSLRISVTILLALVVTLVGVFLALKITGKPLDITSLMGMLIVLSIVINNNVLIYDFYQKNENPDEKKRIVHAIGVRMRPVLMTMFSNAFALLPIALAIGSGTQIIQDMAIAIMGGLFFAIIINLFIMPLFFYWLSKQSV